MSFARKLFATSMIAAACAIPGALLCSATASADPVATPGAPSVPGLPFLSSFNPANAPALIQTMASALTGAPAAATAPAAPAPAATASVTLPQAPAVPAAPATALTAPAAAAAAPSNGLIPSADVKLPQIPGNPLPLPQQVNFPGDLASLAPAGTPLANLFPKPATAAPAVAAATTPLSATAPLTAAAAAPASGFDQLAPLMVPPAALSALP